MTPNKHDPVVVIGSPRSGTTLMAKILTQMGVFMGYNLNDAFEDWFFVDVNEHIMDRLGIYWDRPSRTNGPNVIRKGRLVKYLSSSNAISVDIPWGFKDPRTTIVLDVWQKLWDQMDVEPKYIFMKRHPMDIAVSLLKREHDKPDKMLQAKEPESRSIDSGQIQTYPLKSRRCMKKRGALELAYEYQSVPYRSWRAEEEPENCETLHFEGVVTEPYVAISRLERFLDQRTLPYLKDEIASQMNPDRALAYQDNETLVQFWNQHKREEGVYRYE